MNKLFIATSAALLTISAAYPMPTKAAGFPKEINDKVQAVVQAAQLVCGSKARGFTAERTVFVIKTALKQKGTYSAFPWLNTPQGIKSIRIARQHLSSDCQVKDSEAIAESILDFVLTPQQAAHYGIF